MNGRSTRSHTPPQGTAPVVFLSTSFKRVPYVEEQRTLITGIFGTRFKLSGGWELGEGLQLTKILRGIRGADVVLVEATNLTANVMLELGMSYALSKRVFLLFNLDSPTKAITALPDYVRSLDIVSYRLSADLLKQVRDKIWEKLQVEPDPEELMHVNIRGTSLVPHSDAGGIYLAFPKGRAIWPNVVEQLRDELQREGLRLYTSLAAPSGSSELQEVMFLVRRSSRKGTSCFVDTTGPDVDFVGAFALGVATALRKGVKRLMELGGGERDTLSLWTEHTYHWADRDDLVKYIRKTVSSIRTSRARPNTAKGKRLR